MSDLMRGLLGAHSNSSDIDIEIYDGKHISEPVLMHNTDGILQANNPSQARLHTVQKLKIAHHTWTVAAHSLPAFEARLDKTTPHLIAAAGAGTGGLLALLTWLLIRGRTRALTAALSVRANEARLRSIVDTAMDAVVQMDINGLITGWNGQAAIMFGWTREEAMGRTLHSLIIPKT